MHLMDKRKDILCISNINVCYYLIFAVALSPAHAPYYSLLLKKLLNLCLESNKVLLKVKSLPPLATKVTLASSTGLQYLKKNFN